MNARIFCVVVVVLTAAFPVVSWALPIHGSIEVQPYVVGPVAVPAPADGGIPNDFSFATKVYNQVGIEVVALAADELIVADDDGDGVWSRAEFLATLNNLGRDKPGNPIYAYYVPDYADPGPGGTFADTVSEEDVNGGTILNPGIALQASRRNDTLAHELGHMLTDEWRWKAPESSGGTHSNQADDLMAAGFLRNIPAALADVFPTGNNDEIRHTVGPLNGFPSAIVPQGSAMHRQSSFVANTYRDDIAVGIGIVDGTGGGPTVIEAPIEWGEEVVFGDGPHHTIWRVAEAARTVATNVEQYGFWFHSDRPQDSSFLIEFGVLDIDSRGFTFSDIIDDTVVVEVYSDILSDGGKTTLTVGADYSWSSVIDGTDGDLDKFVVAITKSSVFAGVHDIHFRFDALMTPVPEPAALTLALMAAVGLVSGWGRNRARRRTIHAA